MAVPSVSIDPKPGYLTTEFWVTVLSLLLPAATLIFHKDFSSQVQPIAAAVAGVGTAAYVLSRAWTKSAYVKSRPAPSIPGPAAQGGLVAQNPSAVQQLGQAGAAQVLVGGTDEIRSAAQHLTSLVNAHVAQGAGKNAAPLSQPSPAILLVL